MHWPVSAGVVASTRMEDGGAATREALPVLCTRQPGPREGPVPILDLADDIVRAILYPATQKRRWDWRYSRNWEGVSDE